MRSLKESQKELLMKLLKDFQMLSQKEFQMMLLKESQKEPQMH